VALIKEIKIMTTHTMWSPSTHNASDDTFHLQIT